WPEPGRITRTQVLADGLATRNWRHEITLRVSSANPCRIPNRIGIVTLPGTPGLQDRRHQSGISQAPLQRLRTQGVGRVGGRSVGAASMGYLALPLAARQVGGKLGVVEPHGVSRADHATGLPHMGADMENVEPVSPVCIRAAKHAVLVRAAAIPALEDPRVHFDGASK